VRALRKWLPVAEERSRVLERHGLEPGYAMVTVHRAENVDGPGRSSRVVRLVAGLAGRARVVFPVHPRRRRLAEAGLWEALARGCADEAVSSSGLPEAPKDFFFGFHGLRS
jgi:UDP-N-acetylglucosamine 2-epimerase